MAVEFFDKHIESNNVGFKYKKSAVMPETGVLIITDFRDRAMKVWGLRLRILDLRIAFCNETKIRTVVKQSRPIYDTS